MLMVSGALGWASWQVTHLTRSPIDYASLIEPTALLLQQRLAPTRADRTGTKHPATP